MLVTPILQLGSLSLYFIGALNLFHNLATECWHIWPKREENLQSSVLLLNCLHLFQQHKCSDQAISSVWKIKIIHGLISHPVEASERSLIYIKDTFSSFFQI